MIVGNFLLHGSNLEKRTHGGGEGGVAWQLMLLLKASPKKHVNVSLLKQLLPYSMCICSCAKKNTNIKNVIKKLSDHIFTVQPVGFAESDNDLFLVNIHLLQPFLPKIKKT